MKRNEARKPKSRMISFRVDEDDFIRLDTLAGCAAKRDARPIRLLQRQDRGGLPLRRLAARSRRASRKTTSRDQRQRHAAPLWAAPRASKDSPHQECHDERGVGQAPVSPRTPHQPEVARIAGRLDRAGMETSKVAFLQA